MTTDALEYALFRLERKEPGLHAKVLSGEMSAHSALVRAGLRAPQFTVVGSKPAAVARTLRNNLPAEVLAEVARLIA